MSEDRSTPEAQDDASLGSSKTTTQAEAAMAREDDTRIEEQSLAQEDADFGLMEEKLSTVLSDNERLSREVSDLKDQYLRTRADFENTRKRLQRDKEDSIQQANRSILSDLVGVIDDFERAIKAGKESTDYATLLGGIDLIEKQFTSMLERKWGLVRFNPLGEAFDPGKHEAIAMEARDGVEEQTILEVYQSGFMLHEKILRTAKVKVSSAR